MRIERFERADFERLLALFEEYCSFYGMARGGEVVKRYLEARPERSECVVFVAKETSAP